MIHAAAGGVDKAERSVAGDGWEVLGRIKNE
jgi:hypothetical protein